MPRRSDGEVRVRVSTPDGRLLVEASEPVGDLPIGRAVRASGTIRDPDPWEAATLARVGVRDVLEAERVSLLGAGRAGVASLLDQARSRAEDALGRGTDPARAALLRGFVLGEDDRIDAATVDDFRRSGLAHLLAVSGQNVLLLALLAWPILALLGVGLRARLVAVLCLIALYVPIAGGGASIQRAGIMGAAGVVAALAGRPRSRWYAVLLAVAATLALNPRASGDVGWQLSFAAVIGIMLGARPLADAMRPVGAAPGSVRAAIAEGAAVTVAATVATAPLMAQAFDTVSLVSLPANLLALPAVAPVMWIGMLAGLAGQIPWLPVEPLTGLAGWFAGYIAQVARWLGAPGWAQIEVRVHGWAVLAATYAAIGAVLALAVRWRLRRLGSRPARPRPPTVAIGSIAIAVVAALLLTSPGRHTTDAERLPGLRVAILDVGQGDAILLQPRDGDPVLVDAGPDEADVAGELADRGVDRLAALVVTHPQSDHVGGVADVLEQIDVERLLYARANGTLRREARSAGARPRRIAAGSVARSGSLRLATLWPPGASLDHGTRVDPNRLCLVLVARWHGFEILLTGDAETELAPVDPGPVEVLKVAHHGSADAGLDGLLDRASPRLAVISVGADNPYGHPSPETLGELEAHGVAIERTDLSGTVTIDVTGGRWTVR